MNCKTMIKKCKFCEKGVALFRHRRDKVVIGRSPLSNAPALDIFQGAYNLILRIEFCPKCGRKLSEEK